MKIAILILCYLALSSVVALILGRVMGLNTNREEEDREQMRCLGLGS